MNRLIINFYKIHIIELIVTEFDLSINYILDKPFKNNLTKTLTLFTNNITGNLLYHVFLFFYNKL